MEIGLGFYLWKKGHNMSPLKSLMRAIFGSGQKEQINEKKKETNVIKCCMLFCSLVL